MKVVQDDLWLCQCCTLAAVNGDVCDCNDGHDKMVTEGLERLGAHLVPDFDSDYEESYEGDDDRGDGIREFSRWSCDCCGSHLAGSRHRFAVLGEDEDAEEGARCVH